MFTYLKSGIGRFFGGSNSSPASKSPASCGGPPDRDRDRPAAADDRSEDHRSPARLPRSLSSLSHGPYLSPPAIREHINMLITKDVDLEFNSFHFTNSHNANFTFTHGAFFSPP